MGVRTEEILVQLKLDVEKTKASLLDIKDKIALYNKELIIQQTELARLEKEQGKNSDAYKKQALDVLDTTSQIKALNKEQNSYQLALTKSAQAQLTNTGSLAQMRAELSALTQIYGTRTDAEKLADAQTIKMAANIKALSDVLKKEEGDLGNHTRNVGDYENAIKSALSNVNIFGVNLTSLYDRLTAIRDVMSANTAATEAQTAAQSASNVLAVEQATTQKAAAAAAVEHATAQKLAAVSAEEMTAAEVALAQATVAQTAAEEALSVATTAQAAATGVASGALQVFRIALISTGIGALLVALGSLIAFLTQTQTGLDFIKRVSAEVGAVFRVLINAAASLGRELVDTFSHPIESLKALGSFIETNFINRFKAIPVILSAIGDGFNAIAHLDFSALKQSLKDVASGFVQFGTGLDKVQQSKIADSIADFGSKMAGAARTAGDLAGQMQKLQDAENAYITTRAANEKRIQQLRLEAKEAQEKGDNATRIKDLKEVLAIQQEEIDKGVEFAKRRAEISQQQFELGKKTRDEVKENNEIQAKADEVAAEGLRSKVKFQSELNRALGKDDRQRIADERENAKESEEIQQQLAKAKIDLIKDARTKANAEADEELRHNLATIKEGSTNAAELEQSFIATNEAKKLQIRDHFDQEALKLDLDNQQKHLEVEKQTTQLIDKEAIRAATNHAERLAAELKQVTDNYQLQSRELEINKEKELNDDKKTEQEKSDIRKFYAAKQLDLVKGTADGVAGIQRSSQNQQLQDEIDFEKLREASLLQADSQLAQSRLKVLEAQYQQERILLTQKYTENGKISKKGEDALAFAETKYRKEQVKIAVATEKEKLDVISGALGTAADLFSKNTAAYKILATAEAIINTYKGATLALATYAPPYGAIAAATVIAAGLANVAKINSTETKQEGGFTGQGHPSQVSTRLGAKPYVYHASEYVVPAPVLATPLGASLVRTLETMRVSTSNTTFNREMSFAEGGQTPNFAFINQESSQPVVDQYFMENALIKAALLVPAPVVTVEDINAGQSRVSLSASRANI